MCKRILPKLHMEFEKHIPYMHLFTDNIAFNDLISLMNMYMHVVKVWID